MTAITPGHNDTLAVRGSRMASGARTLFTSATFWALVGAIALAMIYGRVAVTHLTSGLVGGNSNGYEDVWNDYWLRTALRLHRNPFYTDYLFAPNGVSLRFHTLNPFGGLIALPLSPLIGIVGAMNLKFLIALVGSVFFAYLLMRDLAGNPLAAFAGAAVYTYANDQMIAYFSSGAENYLMGTALMPLFLFFLFRALAWPRWWGYAAAASGTLLALCLTDWQYTMFAVLITVLYVLFMLCTRQSWRAKSDHYREGGADRRRLGGGRLPAARPANDPRIPHVAVAQCQWRGDRALPLARPVLSDRSRQPRLSRPSPDGRRIDPALAAGRGTVRPPGGRFLGDCRGMRLAARARAAPESDSGPGD